jgi:prepilin-type N-terminal cleavage/methylation domain-containing protein
MYRLWAGMGRVRRDERGFTMPELLTVIAIMGILLAIAVIIFLALLERWRVNAAINQLAADMRLAHNSATNQLTDWRMVLVPKGVDDASGQDDAPDYYMMPLNGVYDPNRVPFVGPAAESSRIQPRYLPANVKIRNHDPALADNQGNQSWLSPTPTVTPPSPTRTLEFNSDGSMSFRSGPSGSVCVTIDGNPERRLTVQSSTSRVEIQNDACAP